MTSELHACSDPPVCSCKCCACFIRADGTYPNQYVHIHIHMKKPSEFFLLLFSSPYYSVIVNFLGCIENINNCDQLIIMGPIIPADLIALSGFVRIETKEL